MKQGAEMDCPRQTGHLCFLKRVLGVKRTACNWTVLRECGQEPLQFYWFRAAFRFYNAMLNCNSRIVRSVLEADKDLSRMSCAIIGTVITKDQLHQTSAAAG